MKKNYLSVDIGGTNVKFAELDNADILLSMKKLRRNMKRMHFCTILTKSWLNMLKRV